MSTNRSSNSDDGDEIYLEFESSGPPEIAPHEIEYHEKIGGGCFGNVFRGKCRGKEVAVKQLFKQELTEKHMEDFRREIDICSVLRHPNIVLFMGACMVPGHMAIVSELMKGNLQSLLHDKNANLSLFFRMKIARDVALGMNWLHRSNPQVIHRDLKPSNVLIDENHQIKICDFGLSAVKSFGERIVDVDSIPGTPLWMAPEVMLGQPLDEKADVYSFGIVLWEIVTQKEPFPEFDDYKIFRDAICNRGIRPPIDNTILPSILDMMKLCWHQDPSVRPTFDQIIPMFDTVFCDVCISDAFGNRFWRQHFLGRENALWTDFISAFRKATGSPRDELKDNCLKMITSSVLVDPTKKTPPCIVGIEHFGKVLNWFGPIEPKPSAFMDKVRDILQEKWFHGDINKEEAESALKMAGLKSGLYLVRLSSNKAGQFTISKVNKEKKLIHQRFDYNPSTGFTMKLNTKKGTTTIQGNETLKQFLSRLSKPLSLDTPCKGSKYDCLFKASEIGSYDLVDD